MAFLNLFADFRKAQLMIEGLKEEITDLEGILMILCDTLCFGDSQSDILLFKAFFFIQLSNIFFCPFIGVSASPLANIIFISKLFYSNGMLYAMGIIVGFDDVKSLPFFVLPVLIRMLTPPKGINLSILYH